MPVHVRDYAWGAGPRISEAWLRRRGGARGFRGVARLGASVRRRGVWELPPPLSWKPEASVVTGTDSPLWALVCTCDVPLSVSVWPRCRSSAVLWACPWERDFLSVLSFGTVRSVRDDLLLHQISRFLTCRMGMSLLSLFRKYFLWNLHWCWTPFCSWSQWKWPVVWDTKKIVKLVADLEIEANKEKLLLLLLLNRFSRVGLCATP